VARIEKVSQDAKQIEIDKTRPSFQQKRFVDQHFFKRKQAAGQLLKKFFLMRAPLLQGRQGW